MTLTPSEAPVAPKYSWAEIWTAVLTRPSVQTFQEILRDPAVSRSRAFLWVGITWTVSIVFIMILTWRDTAQLLATMPSDVKLSPAEMESAYLTSLLCLLPFALLMCLAVFRLQVWLVQFVAARLGADVNYASGIETQKTKNSDVPNRKSEIGTLVMYSFAAIQAPLNIISLLFAALPESELVRLLSLLPLLYQVYLLSLVLRAVYGFSSGRALASSLISYGIFLAATFGLMYLMLTSMM